MTYENYDWLQIVVDGTVNKLLSEELDKYLQKHGLNTKCKKVDKIKSVTVHVLRNMTDSDHRRKVHGLNAREQDAVEQETTSEEISSEEEGEEEDDLVYADLDEADVSENSEQDEEHTEWSENSHPLITTTRSGRHTGTWRLGYF